MCLRNISLLWVHKYFYILLSKSFTAAPFICFKADAVNFVRDTAKDWIDVFLLTITWLPQKPALSPMSLSVSGLTPLQFLSYFQCCAGQHSSVARLPSLSPRKQRQMGPPTPLRSWGLLSWPPEAETGGFSRRFCHRHSCTAQPPDWVSFQVSVGVHRHLCLTGADAATCQLSGVGSRLACRARPRLGADSFLLGDSAS